MTTCDECGGPIDQATGFCIACGLEASNFKDRRFDKAVLHGTKTAGEEESRYRKARKSELKSGRANRGYVCNRCRELFQSTVRDDSIVEADSRITGFEQPGTNLYTFRLKQEYEDHVRLIHNPGRKGFWNRADKHIRELGRLNKGTSADTLRGEGTK